MNVILERIEKPFVFELTNNLGVKCLVDANKAIGGKEKGFRPMELLAGALAGCIAIDVVTILNKQKLDPSVFNIVVNCDRKEGIPSPFEKIELLFNIDNTVDEKVLSKNIELTLRKYCSVAASLNNDIEINFKIVKQ